MADQDLDSFSATTAIEDTDLIPVYKKSSDSLFRKMTGASLKSLFISIVSGVANLAGAILRGHCGNVVTISSAADLNNTTHQGSDLLIQDATLTIKTQATTPYNDGHQALVMSSHASGGTLTADSGVTINGVDGGSVSISQYEAFGLLRVSENTWLVPNGSAS